MDIELVHLIVFIISTVYVCPGGILGQYCQLFEVDYKVNPLGDPQKPQNNIIIQSWVMLLFQQRVKQAPLMFTASHASYLFTREPPTQRLEF